jgi:hypothetical protein
MEMVDVARPTRYLSQLLSDELVHWVRQRNLHGLNWDAAGEMQMNRHQDQYRYLRHQEDQAQLSRAKRELSRMQLSALEAVKYLEAASEALKAAAETLASAVRADVDKQKR